MTTPASGGHPAPPGGESWLTWLGGLSLALLVALRLTAALATVPVETPWDDRHYRQSAIEEAAGTGPAEALARVVLPNSRPFGIRTVGYHEWLVLGLEAGAAAGVGPERAFQLVNVVLWLLQLAALALFALWATASLPFALLLTALFGSSPVVFGVNRWVLTENLVVTAMLAGSLAAAWLIGRRPAGETWLRRLGAAALAAYAFGLFATTREYAVPALAAIALCVLAALLLERRWGQAAVFAAVLAPFALAVSGPVAAALGEFFHKAGVVRGYFHPLGVWLWYLFFHGLGPALTVLLLPGLAAFAWFAAREWLTRHRAASPPGAPGPAAPGAESPPARGVPRWSGLHLLLAGLLVLTAAYSWSLATTWVRVVRPVLMPMLLALALLLVGLRLLPAFRRAALGARAGRGLAALLGLSWVVLLYQLFFAFDGGRSYLFGAWGPEVLNHPFGIRALGDDEDSHTVTLEQARYRLGQEAWARRRELAERLAGLREGRDPEARERLLADLRRGTYETRPLEEGVLSAVLLTGDGWTGEGTSGLLAVNSGEEELSIRVRANCPAPPEALPLRLFVDDGREVRDFPFAESGGTWVDLPALPPGAAALHLLWTDRTWTPGAEDPRRLGVRLRTVRVRRGD